MKKHNLIPFPNNRERSSKGIKLSKDQVMHLSIKILTKYNLSHFNNAILAYDTKHKAIGIIFVKEPIKNTTLKLSNNNSSKSISLRGFINANKIDFKKYIGQYTPKKATIQGEKEALIIDLTEQG